MRGLAAVAQETAHETNFGLLRHASSAGSCRFLSAASSVGLKVLVECWPPEGVPQMGPKLRSNLSAIASRYFRVSS